LVSDPKISVEIQFKGFVSSTLDMESGKSTRRQTTYRIRALKHTVDVNEAAASGGRLQVGDRMYQVMKEDLTTTVPSTSDKIQEGSDTRAVVSWEIDAFGLSYTVATRSSRKQ
jgi:hypothetical protein